MLHKLLSAFFLASLWCLTSGKKDVSVTRSSIGGNYAPGDLIFEDNFDILNTSLWHHEVQIRGYNNEFQIYDNYTENSYVRDGILYIRPTPSLDVVFNGNVSELYNGTLKLERCTDADGIDGAGCTRQGAYPFINQPIVSARLRTLGSFSFTYGHVQARAKLPSGDWTFPAIWMMPEEDVYGGWPQSGEIDIMECRGNREIFDENGTNIGPEQIISTLNWGPNMSYNGWPHAHSSYNSPPGEGFDRDFHLYELFWDPQGLRFHLDGVQVLNVRPPLGGFYQLGEFPEGVTNIWENATDPIMAPFDSAFHFILNNAVGGDMFTYIDNFPIPPWVGYEAEWLRFWEVREQWLQTWQEDDAAMAIDFIRVYAI